METEIKITILGDVCPTEDYQGYFDRNGEALFAQMASAIRDADYTICNLECPATSNTKPIEKTGPSLRGKPELLGLLKRQGIDGISLANNHVLDFEQKGLLDTLTEADRLGLGHFGGGANAAAAARPLVIEEKGKKIAFLSFAEHEFNLATETGAGANWFDPYRSLSLIDRTKQECDYLIVLYHGGIEHYKFPSPLLQKKCRAMVEAGADAVFCQHSHCIGTMERHLDRPIVYGQGNTIFGYRAGNAAWNEGLLVTLVLGESRVDLNLQLLEATAEGIRRAEKEAEEQRLEEFRQDSLVLQDPEEIADRWKEFCKKSEALVLPNVYGKSRVLNKLNRLTHNRLMNLLLGKRKYTVTLAYIRCEAHHEVLQTILENKINDQ